MLNIVPECYGQYFHDTTYRFPTDLLGRVLWCKAQFDPSFRGFEEMIQIAVSIYPVIKDGKIVNSPWIFSMIFPLNISHIDDFPISAAMWLGDFPAIGTIRFSSDFTMISLPENLGNWIFPEKKPDGLRGELGNPARVYLVHHHFCWFWYLRWFFFAGFLPAMSPISPKKSQSPRAFRLEKHQQLEPSSKIWDTPGQPMFSCLLAHEKHLRDDPERFWGNSTSSTPSLPGGFLRYTPLGGQTHPKFQHFLGDPMNKFSTFHPGGWTERAVFELFRI